MSSRPSLSLDARPHRGGGDDDEYLGSRTSSDRRPHRTNAPDATAEVIRQGPGPRHLVFPDPIALKYLEEDDRAQVIQRRAVLRGYELYLVEQWACSRKSPTLVVATYTGDNRHSIIVGVLAVPANERDWSNRLRVYLKAADQTHTRPKGTELGELMVTNLSCFPSSLTAIPVPDGDLRSHRHIFIVNEDLKRLGCLGRSGLTLTEPTEATQAKFQQLYKTSKDIPFTRSVSELVKLCQVALHMFQKLDHEYIDGLLCDATETAIRNWWADVGGEHYNYEATDGVLGPSTVAALLGLFMGARNRLYWQGAPMPKDVFDVEGTKRGIAYFQKSQKLERTRRLDQQTLFKLITATTKAAAKEGWGVQKAVKSTMTEIGGKRGELVLDMVSGKDKGGLADIETVDIDKFVSLVYGERPKWLWQGKPRRTPLEHSDDRLHGMPPVKAEGPQQTHHQTVKRMHSFPTDDERERERESRRREGLQSLPDDAPAPGEKDALRKTVFKSVAEKMSDARSGLGRIKDAVGARGRGHGHRPPNPISTSNSTKEDGLEPCGGGGGGAGVGAGAGTGVGAGQSGLGSSNGTSPIMGNKMFLPVLGEETSNDPSSSTAARDAEPSSGRASLEARHFPHHRTSSSPSASGGGSYDVAPPDCGSKPRARAQAQAQAQAQAALGRRHSFKASDLSSSSTKRHHDPTPNDARYARRLSFSDAEQAILTWDEIIDLSDIDINNDIDIDIDQTHLALAAASRLEHHIARIAHDISPWVRHKTHLVKLLSEQYAHDLADLHNLYYHLSEACRRVQTNSDEILADGRAALTENIKEIELLVARLDYEIDALAQKVYDVEDGVRIFEGQVREVERRAEELKAELETESWLHWFVRTLTGVGTGPNITAS